MPCYLGDRVRDADSFKRLCVCRTSISESENGINLHVSLAD